MKFVIIKNLQLNIFQIYGFLMDFSLLSLEGKEREKGCALLLRGMPKTGDENEQREPGEFS